MPKKALHLDEIGIWSEIKLEIVKKDAAAYSKILSSQSFSKGHLYIDAFAGAGTHILRRTGAAVKFLSLEPLLGPLPNLDLADINWVIVGGESGPGGTPDEAGLGSRHSRAVRQSGREILFQTVGRRIQEAHRA
jgi:phage protein Gp37/Gp68